MSDDHSTANATLISYLRLPKFTASDPKTPRQAVVHALPIIAFFALNVWGLAFVILGVLAVGLSLPQVVIMALTVVIAVPCGAASWAIAIRCIEVEAGLKN